VLGQHTRGDFPAYQNSARNVMYAVRHIVMTLTFTRDSMQHLYFDPVREDKHCSDRPTECVYNEVFPSYDPRSFTTYTSCTTSYECGCWSS